MLETEHKSYPFQNLLVVDAQGSLDLEASKRMLRGIAADPQFDYQTELLLDLRDVDCSMSTLDVYEIASLLAWPNPALPTRRKIAVLVKPGPGFDNAAFLEMCTSNSGIRLAAFNDYDKASEWLSAEVPPDAK